MSAVLCYRRTIKSAFDHSFVFFANLSLILPDKGGICLGTRVLVLMGSDSDLPVMRAALEAPAALQVTTEVHILSAHRTPQQLADLMKKAPERGIRVIIAGAGAAAHLAGVVAAHTLLPVIAVPLSGKLLGLDALLAEVQMPKGIPVATVAIDGAFNAGLLACQILAVGDPSLEERLVAYREHLAAEVAEKDALLQSYGVDGYLQRKGTRG
ncbi:MAG: 5-(carboxyamino)imidazole ribonucleotide mutase [Firmicutes bacterium]|nr:5-(carboxyamino)imidazole ribonucleotide mutase [Bacillota bacterium]